jgi:hypothetical protein
MKMRQAKATGCVLLATVTLMAGVATAQQENAKKVYDDFNAFCLKYFGAEKEPLVYEKFGKDLKFLPDGSWRHVSENSACVAFETNLPAKGYVEYGETAQYGKRTAEHERHFYLHVHYLKDLKADATYHYRLVATDERGNRIASEDATFETRTIADAIRVPGDLAGPPYVLDKAGATYVLTKDLTIDGRAFEVKADRVTLDLGGHTVIYNNKEMQIAPKASSTVERQTAHYGVECTGRKETTILNGHIKQGAGNNDALSYSAGFNPIMNYAGKDTQVAGVTIEYCGRQMVGIWTEYFSGVFKLHHNVFIDHGYDVLNRHGAACRPFLSWAKDDAKLEVHHNLVKRTRQMGLGGTDVYSNEIYIDSRSTNSFGITGGMYNGRKIHHNRVFGTGFHPMAVAWGNRDTLYDNFIHLEGQKPVLAMSYGEEEQRCNLVGFRLTQYDNVKNPMEDNLYRDNVVVIRVREGSAGTGTWLCSDPFIKNLVFRNNTVKVLAMDQGPIATKYPTVACITAQGDSQKQMEDRPPVIYKDNTFISNIGHVRLSDNYGVGSNHHFYNCRFVRVGDDPRYRMVRIGFWNLRTVGHVFRDCQLEGGASFDSVAFEGEGERSFTVQWTLTVKTEPGAKVTITDKTGKEVFSGNADGEGVASAPLSQYLVNSNGKIFFTPHKVRVETANGATEKQVTMEGKQQIEIMR